ncbi:MAG: DUF3108 domain-containing protein [Gammaproteobacteria bacterium]
MLRFAVAVAAFLTASLALAQPALAPYRAVYHATVKLIPVQATVKLTRGDDDTWTYESVIEPRGWAGFVSRELTETSVLRVVEGSRLVSASYRKRDELGGRDSDIRFDLAAGEMAVRYRDQRKTLPWEPDIHDLMSLRLVLSNDFVLDRLRESYRIVDDKGRVRTVSVTRSGEQALETGVGTLETVQIEYVEDRKDRRYRAWLAPALNGVIVRLEQYEDGELRGSLELAEYGPLEGG